MKNRKLKTRRKHRVKRGGMPHSSKVSPQVLKKRQQIYSKLAQTEKLKPSLRSSKNSQRFSLKNWFPWSNTKNQIVPVDNVKDDIKTRENPFADHRNNL